VQEVSDPGGSSCARILVFRRSAVAMSVPCQYFNMTQQRVPSYIKAVGNNQGRNQRIGGGQARVASSRRSSIDSGPACVQVIPTFDRITVTKF
jgi:hypothetical protein